MQSKVTALRSLKPELRGGVSGRGRRPQRHRLPGTRLRRTPATGSRGCGGKTRRYGARSSSRSCGDEGPVAARSTAGFGSDPELRSYGVTELRSYGAAELRS